MLKFRFHLQQLAALWDANVSMNESQYNISFLESPVPFVLTDEQFSSLLGAVPTSVLSKHFKPTFDVRSKIISATQSNRSNESIKILNESSDIQNEITTNLADHLSIIHRRLQSSVKDHSETIQMVSNSMLKINHLENILHRAHQISVDTMNDISTDQVENLPSFVIDLLKVDPISEKIYESISKGDLFNTPNKADRESIQLIDLMANNNLNKEIIEGIQNYQLSFSQIHNIQTQFLTSKLIGSNQIVFYL